MKKSLIASLLVASLIFLPFTAMADLGDVIAKSKDIEINMFGSLKTFPHFIENADFNSDDTRYDFIIDENGTMENHAVRTEARIGWDAKADDWDFMIILESDFNLNKANADRGADKTAGYFNQMDTGFTGEDFGIEKLNFGYNFGPCKINTGWNTKFLDIMSGGILYGDDHPYIGLEGAFGKNKWEALYIIVQDDISNQGAGGVIDGDSLDWRVYTLRVGFDLNGFTLAPLYAFSDNEDRSANVHYMGVEGYGKLGIFTPRFEFVYATGEQTLTNQDLDISAFGAFASIEAGISKALNVYVGGYYLSGDDDPNDDDIEAFNGITNIGRYTPTFGMENAMIYRYVPALGTHLYSNNFNVLGSKAGYGGISNSSKADAPGMIMMGIGARGCLTDQLSYKTQVMYFAFEEQGALEQVAGKSIDDEVGIEADLQLTYSFNPHFSIGNVIAVFFPGDGVEDRLGPAFDETAYVDTIELTWQF